VDFKAIGKSRNKRKRSIVESLLVTGGAGFIGSNFVEQQVARGRKIVVLDALTYAGHVENLAPWRKQIEFVRGDICDRDLVRGLLSEHRVNGVVNFAAETHVDRSIADSEEFVRSNVLGVHSLLSASLDYFEKTCEDRDAFRFLHVSTDEVFGALGDTGKFSETSPYAPNSPYSASKAGGDLLVRAWFHTYQLPVITTNCSNNYGPRQYPEKLIPHMISCALAGKRLPVYGQGLNTRDWIHVQDHSSGVALALEEGKPGETYCFGGNSERKNIDVVRSICAELDRQRPKSGSSYSQQITFVEDRKGHDWRYAIDDTKAARELGFKRQFASFEAGLKQTVAWYLENMEWMKNISEGLR
jgi:dTDP-glucose 4,6-dehydratase